MKNSMHMFLAATMMLAVTFSGCTQKQKDGSKEIPATLEAERGEGEESGVQLTLDQEYDELRKGTHMLLSYDAESNSFKGTVENVSDKVLDRVRVEVHLSNGTELGPTTQVDLQPGEKRNVSLAAGSDDFSSWSTHAEVGSGEHGHEGEGEHEHSHEGEGAHEHN